ncbi:hypothetical protein [Steroidobacter sp.]|uniref:hypothetical protein n=1 Tax=Steroidobacter sp. TaxID=1978227 RepID=UPI002EDB9224
MEWLSSDDAGAMLEYLFHQRRNSYNGAGEGLTRSLHRFYLASCRGIWPLLPQEASRKGVELSEQFLAGKATAEQLSEYNWHTEAAAFRIDYADADDDMDVARWVAEVKALPAQELRAMLHPPSAADEAEPRELLKQAAYFADYAMSYQNLRRPEPPPMSYRPFLSAEILRQYVAYPGPVGE